MDMSIDFYAVLGNPITHSRSPEIHACFAEQTAQRLRYERRLVPPGEFAAVVAALRTEGLKGANVTLPVKQDAWQLATRRSAAADRARAVNTLTIGPDGQIHGDNTDGVGLIRDLRGNLEVDLRGVSILLLGAGGAARGVLQPLLAEQPGRLLVANRTAARARSLATEFADLGETDGCGLDEIPADGFDVVINATAASLGNSVPAVPPACITHNTVCYDMAYGAGPTPFVRWATDLGAALAADGLGMLVEQAAESFRIWRAVKPDTAPVIATLRQKLQAPK